MKDRIHSEIPHDLEDLAHNTGLLAVFKVADESHTSPGNQCQVSLLHPQALPSVSNDRTKFLCIHFTEREYTPGRTRFKHIFSRSVILEGFLATQRMSLPRGNSEDTIGGILRWPQSNIGDSRYTPPIALWSFDRANGGLLDPCPHLVCLRPRGKLSRCDAHKLCGPVRRVGIEVEPISHFVDCEGEFVASALAGRCAGGALPMLASATKCSMASMFIVVFMVVFVVQPGSGPSSGSCSGGNMENHFTASCLVTSSRYCCMSICTDVPSSRAVSGALRNARCIRLLSSLCWRPRRHACIS